MKKLLKLYPQMTWQHRIDTNPNVLNMPYNGGYYVLDTTDLTQKEIRLLTVMIEPDEGQSDWEQFFVNGVPLKHLEKGYRCIYVHFLKDIEDKALWFSVFSNAFGDTIDYFNTGKDDITCVFNDALVDYTQIEGVVQALNDDFSTQVSVYIGEVYSDASTFNACAREEHTHFLTIKHRPGVYWYRKDYLRISVIPKLMQSEIMMDYSKQITSYPEDVELIISLWEFQGNQTLASQKLYIHRNTLNYRIDRFEARLGLNLRDTKDLLLCYLVCAK